MVLGMEKLRHGLSIKIAGGMLLLALQPESP